MATSLLACITFINNFVNWTLFHHDYSLDRLVPIGIFFFISVVLLGLSRSTGQHRLPSLVLVSMLFTAAISVAYEWSIIDPIGLLLFSLVIVMASILLGARYALYAALLTTASVTVLEIAKAHHHVSPNLAWEKQPSSLSDVINFSAIFATLALISWLFNSQINHALSRAERSEKALRQQRDLLEITVEERTQALQAAQFEQVREIYRFAELGHLSTALFHDLANHIMSLSLDIEGLQNEQRSDLLKRIRTNVKYINNVICRVQTQMRGHVNQEEFNVIEEVKEIIEILAYAGNKRAVTIELDHTTKGPISYFGDITRFRQIIINLLSNAIEAYPKQNSVKSRKVVIELSQTKNDLLINITDQGKGIPAKLQAKIFEPFYTTKASGMGIGLFIVKKIVEQDFGGSLKLTSSPEKGTKFVVKLPGRALSERS